MTCVALLPTSLLYTHIVKRAIQEVLYKEKITFYEDLPYASKIEQRQIQNQVNEMPLHMNPLYVDITLLIDQKKADIAIYESQLEEELINSVVQ